MIAVIQRTSKASVSIENKIKASIGEGLVILLGVEDTDDDDDIEWLSRKIANLRIFNDADGVMNLSCKEIDGEAMVISQFTLHASTKKGNRPSYLKASKPNVAIPRYEQFVSAMKKQLSREIKTGEFGAQMDISLINSGPVTIIIDTKDKK